MITETTKRGTKWKPLLLIAFVGAFVLVVVVALGSVFFFIRQQQLANGPQADERLRTLEKEFTLIAPLPDAYQMRYGSTHKVSLGLVGADYRTDKSYVQIRAHYDLELKNNGWKFVGEKPMKIWWRDYGGKKAFYCKDDYTATLQYAGDWEEAGWTYSFSMSWGLRGECK